MARLARLTVPGQLHLVAQRGHGGSPMAHDEADARQLLDLVRTSAAAEQVALHGYALTTGRLLLLVTPATERGISRMVQAVGRHYAGWFNRRHGRQGGVWNGRFGCTVVEPGPMALAALCLVDAPADASGSAAWTSAEGRRGGFRDPAVTDPPEYWGLGNTPFDREARYRERLAEPEDESARHLLAALRSGRPCGSPAFIHSIAQATQRDLTARPRGRPPRRSTPDPVA